MLKKYLLFYGVDHEPAGGWNDFKGSFDSELEALRHCAGDNFEWIHIIDRETGDRIFSK